MPLEEILANINREGKVPEALVKEEDKADDTNPNENDNSDENTTDSQPETNQEEEKPSHQGDVGEETEDENEEKETKPNNTDDEEDKLPFHKHPRFKQLTDENRTLKQELEEIKSGFAELKQNNNKGAESKEDAPPDWFVGIFGEDETTWKQFSAYDNQRLQLIEKRIVEQIKEEQKQEQEATNKWEKWVDDEVQRLKDEGNEFNKNELIKTALEYRPTNEQGYYDLEKALKIMNSLKATTTNNKVDVEKNKARKKIADISKSSSPEDKQDGLYSTKDLRNTDWKDL